MATIDEVRDKLDAHEKQCLERYGAFNTRFATIETGIGWLTKILWAVFGAILLFELNALFKLVGH